MGLEIGNGITVQPHRYRLFQMLDIRPRKLWRIMVQYFGQKPSFRQNVLGSEVQGSKVQGLVPYDLPNKLN